MGPPVPSATRRSQLSPGDLLGADRWSSCAEFNAALLADPSAINIDGYDGGWLFEIESAGEELMDAEAYVEHLTAVWEVTQRTIKGQMNE